MPKVLKSIINIYLPKNNAVFISIISVFIAFAVVLYLKPSVFVFAFHSVLGNLLLICVLTGIWFLDKNLSIGLGLLLLIVYLSSNISVKTVAVKNDSSSTLKKEGFQGGWSDQTIADFKEFQASRNPNVQYDLNVLQRQATEDEARQLFETGQWPWSKKVKQLYMNAIGGSSNISIDPGIALSDAQAIYNENAIKEVLAWGSKEGVFLTQGAIIGHPKNMPQNINNLVRCGTADDGSAVMQKIEYLGYNGINSSMDKKITDLSPVDIPKELTGFSFINAECNPCISLNDVPEYTCPFKLDVGNGNEVSDIWKIMWGLGQEKKSEKQKNEVPILSKLRDELNKATTSDGLHLDESETGVESESGKTEDVIDNSEYSLLQNDNTREIGENLSGDGENLTGENLSGDVPAFFHNYESVNE
jgi:hypothetical protein